MLHIAECQALTGKLVEASETYETLIRKNLGANPPDAFVQAQQQGQAELTVLRQRIPTLRVTVRPAPSAMQNLQVTLNGTVVPNEVLGIARPVNPGTYRLRAVASGWETASPTEVNLAEREQRSTELTLVQRAVVAPAIPVVPATAPPPPPVPAPYSPNGSSVDKAEATASTTGPSSTGLLLGVRGGILIPGGGGVPNEVTHQKQDLTGIADNGGGIGIDAYLRLVKKMLIGATFEYGALKSPSEIANVTQGVNVQSAVHSTYLGAMLGIMPNVDRVSFIGDLGVGYRSLVQHLEANGETGNRTNSGVEFAVGAGLSIPAGPVRIVPRLSVNVGDFSDYSCKFQCTAATGPGADGTHTFVFLGLGLYYNVDLAKKPAPATASNARYASALGW